jgi:uncharacterized membrane protein
MRFKRDFSFLFLGIVSVILSYVCVYGGSWRRKDEAASLLENRCRVIIVIFVLVNIITIYFLWEHSYAKEYNPQLHAFQALLLLLNMAVYIFACK